MGRESSERTLRTTENSPESFLIRLPSPPAPETVPRWPASENDSSSDRCNRVNQDGRLVDTILAIVQLGEGSASRARGARGGCRASLRGGLPPPDIIPGTY